jgi:hypothetical protein
MSSVFHDHPIPTPGIPGRLIMKSKLALVCALGLVSVNAMACYTVYDRSNNIVYNSQTAPVDMSRPIHETVPAKFPGGTMVFDLSSDCPREAPVRTVAAPPPSRNTPLLTDRRTAAAMGVPHTILPSGVAMIRKTPAVLAAGVSVIPTASRAPAVAPVIAPAVTAQRGQRQDTVITELHNPPLTVVQQGGMVISER